ncbi:unannotated protein [freshwater metagenome]|uniref:Unannotated protein n=1 Tax=freshwater metagenome TaxID=449393 RepID=A0A6J6U3A3_9ZZZZ
MSLLYEVGANPGCTAILAAAIGATEARCELFEMPL